jgi:hypothetical protein
LEQRIFEQICYAFACNVHFVQTRCIELDHMFAKSAQMLAVGAGDHFINTGNWQWLSASNFFYQFYRVYSPVTFGQKYDKEGKFVRHFLPVLKDMPWKAPADVQQKANCIIGKDYPEPIVDHKAASQANKDKMKEAYDKHKQPTQASPGKRKR